jgi:hypothetical protein
MTIRKKIFILAGIPLALFGLVVGALAFVQKLNNDQIGNIVAYELPLSRLVAEFDVYTDRYELVILRALREDSASSQDLKSTTSATQVIADELRADVANASALLDKAIQDPRYQTSDRVDLARIAGSTRKHLAKIPSRQRLTETAKSRGNRHRTRNSWMTGSFVISGTARREHIHMRSDFSHRLRISWKSRKGLESRLTSRFYAEQRFHARIEHR